jgi:hypothetical protein
MGTTSSVRGWLLGKKLTALNEVVLSPLPCPPPCEPQAITSKEHKLMSNTKLTSLATLLVRPIVPQTITSTPFTFAQIQLYQISYAYFINYLKPPLLHQLPEAPTICTFLL